MRKRPSPEAQVFPNEGYPTPSAYPYTEQYKKYLQGERERAPNALEDPDQASVIRQPAEGVNRPEVRPIVPIVLEPQEPTAGTGKIQVGDPYSTMETINRSQVKSSERRDVTRLSVTPVANR